MKKFLFLIISIVACLSMSSIVFASDITIYKLRTSCSFAGCDAWIETNGYDPLPIGFYYSGDWNNTDEIKIRSTIRKTDWTKVPPEHWSIEFQAIHIKTNSWYEHPSTPKFELVIYNGMQIVEDECHYINEPDFPLYQLQHICFYGDEVWVTWVYGLEPYWYNILKEDVFELKYWKSKIDSWKDVIDSWKSSINSTITNIQNILTDHESRISTLEESTTTTTTTTLTSTTTTITTTTTIPSGDLEARVSALENLVGKFTDAICSIRYADYFGFCPEKCPRPYICKRASYCVDDTEPRYCYNRTVYPEYFCSRGYVCCESERVDCSIFS